MGLDHSSSKGTKTVKLQHRKPAVELEKFADLFLIQKSYLGLQV